MKPFFRLSLFTSSRLLLLVATLCAATARAAEPAAITTVDSLVADIVAHHPELAFYEAEIAVAKSSARTAGALADPELTASVGRKRVRDAAGQLAGEGTAWSVSLAQTFDWPGRLALRKSLANRQTDLAELGLARFRAALAARARTLAYGLHAAQEKAEATAEVATRYRELREVFLARDPAGLTPLLETRVIEAQEIALQRRATDAALSAQAALYELNQLRGAPPATPLRLEGHPARLATARLPSLDAAFAAARENNFDFRAAKLEVEQQGLAVSLARHERRPSVTVAPFLSQENAGDRERTFGLGVTVPLPVTSRASNGVATAEARRRQAEAGVAAAQFRLEREIALTVGAVSARTAEMGKWSADAADKFREAAALADRHYRLGAVPLATYVELQNAYLDAVSALLDTQREALESGLQLSLLTGLDLFAAPTASAP